MVNERRVGKSGDKSKDRQVGSLGHMAKRFGLAARVRRSDNTSRTSNCQPKHTQATWWVTPFSRTRRSGLRDRTDMSTVSPKLCRNPNAARCKCRLAIQQLRSQPLATHTAYRPSERHRRLFRKVRQLIPIGDPSTNRLPARECTSLADNALPSQHPLTLLRPNKAGKGRQKRSSKGDRRVPGAKRRRVQGLRERGSSLQPPNPARETTPD
jgi:hypothetical protein